MDERVASRLGDLRRVVNITLNVPDFRREGEATSNNDLKALSNLTLYQDKTFESFNISSPYTAHLRPEIHRIQHYADDPNDHWLLVIGGHGAGKTHLAAAVANYWSAMHGKETVLVNTADLLDFLRATFSPDSNTSFSTRFQLIREIPLLLLDDFQVSSKTPVWSREKLFQLIDYRYLAKLPTVFASTRAHFQELKEAHPHIYSRIFDRSLAVVVMLENTKDYRLLEV
jgi:DNA replication protein DnaC